ncbi:hypothetical protein [Halobacteriovorax sp. RZ-2]|uniref:hypothetical protein n=1 Tax=unclassified Halobacteriovorax TaxID=2639665 RepID=UPI00371F2D69
MKKLLMILLLMFTSTTFANDVDDMFGSGEDQFEFEKFSNEEILLRIEEDIKVSCRKGECTLFSTENKFAGFEVGFNIGEGMNQQAGSGVNIYTGGYGGQINGEYWGVNVRYYNGKCTQRIKVPKSVYIAINRYMYGLLDTDGNTRRGFTPADEAMILFYTTIIGKSSNCNGNGGS